MLATVAKSSNRLPAVDQLALAAKLEGPMDPLEAARILAQAAAGGNYRRRTPVIPSRALKPPLSQKALAIRNKYIVIRTRINFSKEEMLDMVSFFYETDPSRFLRKTRVLFNSLKMDLARRIQFTWPAEMVVNHERLKTDETLEFFRTKLRRTDVCIFEAGKALWFYGRSDELSAIFQEGCLIEKFKQKLRSIGDGQPAESPVQTEALVSKGIEGILPDGGIYVSAQKIVSYVIAFRETHVSLGRTTLPKETGKLKAIIRELLSLISISKSKSEPLDPRLAGCLEALQLDNVDSVAGQCFRVVQCTALSYFLQMLDFDDKINDLKMLTGVAREWDGLMKAYFGSGYKNKMPQPAAHLKSTNPEELPENRAIPKDQMPVLSRLVLFLSSFKTSFDLRAALATKTPECKQQFQDDLSSFGSLPLVEGLDDTTVQTYKDRLIAVCDRVGFDRPFL